MVYYLEMTLVGHRESNVAIVSGVQFIDKVCLSVCLTVCLFMSEYFQTV